MLTGKGTTAGLRVVRHASMSELNQSLEGGCPQRHPDANSQPRLLTVGSAVTFVQVGSYEYDRLKSPVTTGFEASADAIDGTKYLKWHRQFPDARIFCKTH
jgi:hypothetical protein